MVMAPNALGSDHLHEQDHAAFHGYVDDGYSDSELDGGRGKGANGKPRTRLGYQRISIACLYCRRRKIRCLPPVGEGDRCQNCARQQRECVVQPIAGSTRKGGRNQGNAVSTDPMPYAEALSMTRQSAANNTLAHRRSSQKSPSERHYDNGYFPTAIAIPSYGYGGPPSVGLPFSAPAHFTSPPLLPPHDQSGYNVENGRRPPFKHMQSAPGGMYTLHHGFERSGEPFRSGSASEGYPGQWPPTTGPHYASVPPTDAFHGPGQDLSTDASNPFWRLNGTSLTSPTATTTEIALPPPRPSNAWLPNVNSNYTHERPSSSVTLPAPHHSVFGESSAVTTTQPTYYATGTPAPVFQPSSAQSQGSTHSSHEEHPDTNHWARPTAMATTASYRSN